MATSIGTQPTLSPTYPARPAASTAAAPTVAPARDGYSGNSLRDASLERSAWRPSGPAPAAAPPARSPFQGAGQAQYQTLLQRQQELADARAGKYGPLKQQQAEIESTRAAQVGRLDFAAKGKLDGVGAERRQAQAEHDKAVADYDAQHADSKATRLAAAQEYGQMTGSDKRVGKMSDAIHYLEVAQKTGNQAEVKRLSAELKDKYGVEYDGKTFGPATGEGQDTAKKLVELKKRAEGLSQEYDSRIRQRFVAEQDNKLKGRLDQAGQKEKGIRDELKAGTDRVNADSQNKSKAAQAETEKRLQAEVDKASTFKASDLSPAVRDSQAFKGVTGDLKVQSDGKTLKLSGPGVDLQAKAGQDGGWDVSGTRPGARVSSTIGQKDGKTVEQSRTETLDAQGNAVSTRTMTKGPDGTRTSTQYAQPQATRVEGEYTAEGGARQLDLKYNREDTVETPQADGSIKTETVRKDGEQVVYQGTETARRTYAKTATGQTTDTTVRTGSWTAGNRSKEYERTTTATVGQPGSVDVEKSKTTVQEERTRVTIDGKRTTTTRADGTYETHYHEQNNRMNKSGSHSETARDVTVTGGPNQKRKYEEVADIQRTTLTGETSAAHEHKYGPFEPPTDVPTGQIDFYKQRNEDFIKRHPHGPPPPDYYLDYGNKYAHKFTEQIKPDLSPEGQKWLDKTFKNLQEAIEQKRREDPAAFARLEENPEAFKKFAYDTHAKAYLDGGLADLPVSDLIKIGGTPEFKDLFTKDGMGQGMEVIERIYNDRGLGYFFGKAGSAVVEYANPITGPYNTASTVITVAKSHPEETKAVVNGAAWVLMPGPMLVKDLLGW